MFGYNSLKKRSSDTAVKVNGGEQLRRRITEFSNKLMGYIVKDTGLENVRDEGFELAKDYASLQRELLNYTEEYDEAVNALADKLDDVYEIVLQNNEMLLKMAETSKE